MSSNQEQSLITDEEIVTIYIFGVISGHNEVESIYKYVFQFLKEWFPSLPCCEGFCYRLNKINLDKNLIIDSLPIVVAGSSGSRRAKVAPDIANKDFCVSKKYIITV